MKFKNLSLLALSAVAVGALTGCGKEADTNPLPAVQSAAKQQPGANVPPAAATAPTAAEVQKMKSGD